MNLLTKLTAPVVQTKEDQHYCLAIQKVRQLYIIIKLLLSNCRMDGGVIKALLQKLDSAQIKQAQRQLLEKCQSEQGLNQLKSLLIDPSISTKMQKFAASVINLILSKSGFFQNLRAFAEKYMKEIIGDWKIGFQLKIMLMRSANMYIERSHQFLEDLYSIAIDTFDMVSIMANEQTQKGQHETNTKRQIIQGCQVVIWIGYFLAYNMPDEDEDGQISSRISQCVLDIAHYCTTLHRFLIDTDFSHIIWRHLFKFYSVITETKGITIIKLCYAILSQCKYLPKIIKGIYSISTDQSQGYFIQRVALVHFQIIKYYSSIKLIESIDNYFSEPLIEFLLKECIEKTIYPIQQINETNKKIYYFTAILKEYYSMNAVKMTVEDMMHISQNFIFPILSNCLACYKQQTFINNPAQMHQFLSAFLRYDSEYRHFMSKLTQILSNFVDLQLNFFLFLFQRCRHSLELILQCGNTDEWQPPSYLQGKQPLDIDLVLYLLPYIKFPEYKEVNQIITGIYSYLETIITPSFLKKLQNFSIALFYLFMQNAWYQIYGDTTKKAEFLVEYLFDKQISLSARYFIYQFVYELSDYVIDTSYVMIYVHNMLTLDLLNDKWKVLIKWLGFVQEFSEDYLLQLTALVKAYFNHSIYQNVSKKKRMEYVEVRNYLDVLTKIARSVGEPGVMNRLQKVLLTQFTSLQKFISQQIEDNYYSLIIALTPLIPSRQNYEKLFIKYLLLILQQNKGKSTKFYLLLAQYIYYLRKKEIINAIYQHIISTIAFQQLLRAQGAQQFDKVLTRICNCLIIFQNIQIKHWDQIGESIVGSLMKLLQKVKLTLTIVDTLISLTEKLKTKQLQYVIYKRIINIQLLHKLHQKQYEKFNLNEIISKRYLLRFRQYDAKLLIHILSAYNEYVSQQNRGYILAIVKDILQTRYHSIIELDIKAAQRVAYFLPYQMSPVITLESTIYRQAQKLMNFYRVPIWDKSSQWKELLDKATFSKKQFVNEFQELMLKCKQKDEKQSKEKESQYILINGKQTTCNKRGREYEEESQDDSQEILPAKRKLGMQCSKVKLHSNHTLTITQSQEEEVKQKQVVVIQAFEGRQSSQNQSQQPSLCQGQKQEITQKYQISASEQKSEEKELGEQQQERGKQEYNE